MTDLKQEFSKLEQHSAEDVSYKVLSLEGFEHKVGKSSEGFPMFFVCVKDSTTMSPDIVREFLSVRYHQFCRIETEEGVIEKSYAIITLTSQEWALQASFLDIMLLTIQNMRSTPTRKELAVRVENLITIFSALVNPPVKKMQGLWGELFVIEQSRYPEALIGAWHSSPKAKFDFTSGCYKIEVKTTSGENRLHTFSLDQLNPSPSSKLLVASIRVRESGKGNGGLSIRDLMNRINQKAGGVKEQLHIYEIVAQTIGNSITKLEDVCFDYSEACDSLKYFWAQDIPHIKKKDVPPMVTGVKFTSDLTDVPSAFDKELSEDCMNNLIIKSIRR